MLATNPDSDDIVLDFFSGSSATAHAVMQLNAEDGNRRFICVQIPELCDAKSEAAKAGYSNICEIGKERIRRAGAKISEFLNESGYNFKKIVNEGTPYCDDAGEQIGIRTGIYDTPGNVKQINAEMAAQLDTGFRVFKLDSSNLKLWDDTPITGDNALAELEARIRGMLDIIKPNRCEQDLVYEVMLKLGQDLCEPIVPIDLDGGKTVYGVGAEVKFIVCLAPGITPEDAAAMEHGIRTYDIFGTYRDDSPWEAQPHAWLMTDDKTIVDITGDQFKYNPELLNYSKPVYVGQGDAFHQLFKSECRGIHNGLVYGNAEVQRIFDERYRIIKKYI